MQLRLHFGPEEYRCQVFRSFISVTNCATITMERECEEMARAANNQKSFLDLETSGGSKSLSMDVSPDLEKGAAQRNIFQHKGEMPELEERLGPFNFLCDIATDITMEVHSVMSQEHGGDRESKGITELSPDTSTDMESVTSTTLSSSVDSDPTELHYLEAKVADFVGGMSFEGEDKASSLEEQSAAVYKRIEALAGAFDARPILPLWQEYCHVHKMFEFWARVHPYAPALEIWQDPNTCPCSLSYEELNDRAENVSSMLLRLTSGKKANGVVVIHIPRSAELVIAILAVVKAGMAFAAVDTEELPLERLHFILQDTRSNILLTTCHDKESPAVDGILHLHVEDIMHFSLAETHRGSPNRSHEISDADLLALIYTSGSTGRPKGVMLQHGAFANYHAVEQRLAGVTPSDRVVHTQSISFVSGVGEIFRALCAGATLLMCGAEVRRQGPDLLPWLESKRVTVFKAVPSMLRGLISPEPTVLKSLRLVIASGEACTKEIVDFFAPSVVLINTYGPTETCSNNMFKVCLREEEITIGIPYPTFTVHLLDKTLEVNSQYGQICVSGMSLAKGYLNYGTKAFIQHKTLGRLYLTGDMGEMTENGDVRYAGRTDSQVKIKGYRIELGEVESKFLKLDGVSEAAVVYNEGRLHCFVVTDTGCWSDVTLLQWRDALLRGGLGEYALPHSVTVVQNMPRTVSGKIDRKRLPLPVVQDTGTGSIDPDSSSTQQILLAAFARILGQPPASFNGSTNFFEQGGDSSAAGLLISHLRSCGLRFSTLSVKDLYMNPTPNELVCVIGPHKLDNNGVYASANADLEESNNAEDAPRGIPNMNKVGNEFKGIYQGRMVATVQFLYFLGACLMDGASVRVGIWCLLYSRVWLFSLIGIDATKWGFGIEEPFKMICIHAVLLYCLFYVVAWMWFGVWFLLLFLAKWLLIGVYTPGLKTSRSWFVRNWIVGRIAARIPWSVAYGTPLGNLMLTLLGAKIGKRAYLAIDSRAPISSGYDCIEIGEDASINHAFVSAVTMTPYGVDVGNVRVLDRAIVDPRATLLGHNTLMEDSKLGCLSNMKRGDVIPSGEYWCGGYPAIYSRGVPAAPPVTELRGRNLGYHTYHAFRCVYNFVTHLGIGISLTVTTAVLLFVTNHWWTPLIFVFFILFHIPWATVIMIIVPALYIKSINYFNDLSEGDYHLYSWQSLLISLKQGLFAVPQGLLNNTFFLVDWMRWCGAKIGRRSEVARVRGAVPDMMYFGDETFLANYTHVATPQIIGKALRVGSVKVGDRLLAGNRSVIPVNTKMGDDVLLGVLSLAPDNDVDTSGKTWIGNPPFAINQGAGDTYPEPNGWEAEMRRVWDVIAICAPLTLLGAMSISWFLLAHVFHRLDTIFPYVVHSAAAGFIVRVFFSFLTAKWLFWYFENGAKPSHQDYWSEFNHRWHIYSKIWATFIRPTILVDVEGSWYMNKFLTMCTNMKIGKGAYLACADAFREHDLVSIGEGSVINTFGELRTHTFENWKLKLNHITIGDCCTIGHSSTLMANSMIRDFAEVGSNTFIMKNEVLVEDTFYSGLPGAPLGKSRTAKIRDEGLPQPSHLMTCTKVSKNMRRQLFLSTALLVVLTGVVACIVVIRNIRARPPLPFYAVPKVWNEEIDKNNTITIGAVGDVLLESTLQRQAARHGSYAESWKAVTSLLQYPDITYGNFEGTASFAESIPDDPDSPNFNLTDVDRGQQPLKYAESTPGVFYSGGPHLQYNYHPMLAKNLAGSGFDVVSTSNNHALDRGLLGINSTIDALDKANVAHTGTRKSPDEPWYALIKRQGWNTAWVACTDGTNESRNRRDRQAHLVLNCFSPRYLDLIKSLAADPTIHAVMAIVHWGSRPPSDSEGDTARDAGYNKLGFSSRGRVYQRQPDCAMRHWTRTIAEAGATAILGAHPHVLHGWEKYTTSFGRQVLVVHSLGNFNSHGGYLVTKPPPEFLGRGYESEVSFLLRRTSVLLQFGVNWNDERNWAEVSCLSYVPLYRRLSDIGLVEPVLTAKEKTTYEIHVETPALVSAERSFTAERFGPLRDYTDGGGVYNGQSWEAQVNDQGEYDASSCYPFSEAPETQVDANLYERVLQQTQDGEPISIPQGYCLKCEPQDDDGCRWCQYQTNSYCTGTANIRLGELLPWDECLVLAAQNVNCSNIAYAGGDIGRCTCMLQGEPCNIARSSQSQTVYIRQCGDSLPM